jgi:hypothetical protein
VLTSFDCKVIRTYELEVRFQLSVFRACNNSKTGSVSKIGLSNTHGDIFLLVGQNNRSDTQMEEWATAQVGQPVALPLSVF